MTKDESRTSGERLSANMKGMQHSSCAFSSFVIWISLVIRRWGFVIDFIPRDRRGHVSITRTNLLLRRPAEPLFAQWQSPHPPSLLLLCATQSVFWHRPDSNQRLFARRLLNNRAQMVR